MVNQGREPGTTGDGVSRRTILKRVAAVGAAGTVLTGTASASSFDTITFRAAENGSFSFQLIVTGKIKVDNGVVPGVVSDEDVQVAGNVVNGTLSDGEARSFEFSGDISILQLSGRGKVLVNGTVIRDTTGGDEEKRLPKKVVVSSPDTNELLNYQFRVTGDLEKLEPNEDSGEAVDEVIDLGDGGTRVRGGVSTGNDKFAFSGKLIREDIPPEVVLEISRR